MKIDPKFYKIMALTESDNDHEALNALRAANRMLKGNKLTWKNVLDHAQDSGHEELRKKYNQLVNMYNAMASQVNVKRGFFR